MMELATANDVVPTQKVGHFRVELQLGLQRIEVPSDAVTLDTVMVEEQGFLAVLHTPGSRFLTKLLFIATEGDAIPEWNIYLGRLDLGGMPLYVFDCGPIVKPH